MSRRLSTFLAISALLCTAAFRVRNDSTGEPASFVPYETGFVGYYGEPSNPTRERVNEGASETWTSRAQRQGRIDGVNPRQICPRMVGPAEGGVYYCGSSTHGYCDRRSGMCFCNIGYTGEACESCTSSHYPEGGLCYPKLKCPGDCSGNGACDYSTGVCDCNEYRSGEDCALLRCDIFHQLCGECTSQRCTKCFQGFSVTEDGLGCDSCARFDPRCTDCDEVECLACGDSLLQSSRRSGHRALVDPELPPEESRRPLTISLAFGSQNPLFFRDAEEYRLVDRMDMRPNGTVRHCVQNQGPDMLWTPEWSCTDAPSSHVMCGHRGVLQFSSPTYEVGEAEDFVLITVERSGGGVGEAMFAYAVMHETTNAEDVSPMMRYESTQTLRMNARETSMTFKIQIHDDNGAEEDETFLVILLEDLLSGGAREALSHDGDFVRRTPSYYKLREDPNDGVYGAVAQSVGVDGAGESVYIGALGRRVQGTYGRERPKFGAQSVCRVTILDDDHLRSSMALSRVEGPGLSAPQVLDDSALNFFDITTIRSDGSAQSTTTGETFLVEYRVYGQSGGVVAPLVRGDVADLGNGVYQASYRPQVVGPAELTVVRATPGGLRGHYFNDAFNEWKEFSRIDKVVLFDWGLGRLTATGTDMVSVVWEGRLLTPAGTGMYTFHIRCDGQVRFTLDSVALVDAWDRVGGVHTASHLLTAGVFHDLQIEYRHLSGEAHISFEYEAPGAGVARQTVPPTALYYIEHLEGSPFQPIAYSGPTAPTKCLAFGIGLIGGIVGETAEIFVVPRDGDSNHRADVELDDYVFLEATIVSDAGGGVGLRDVPGDVDYVVRDGIYRVGYSPHIAGNYTLSVTINGDHIQGSPFPVTFQPTLPFAKTSTFQAPSNSVAGDNVLVTVRLRDRFHNIVEGAGYEDKIVVYLRHDVEGYVAFGDEVSVNEHGEVQVQMTPELKGSYSLVVSLDHVDVKLSPQAFHVSPASAFGSRSSASGVALERVVTEALSDFVVEGRDSFGNIVDSSFLIVASLTLLDGITDATDAGVACTALVPSLVRCTFTAAKIGLLKLRITIDGVDVVDSPFEVQADGGDAEGASSTASGSGLVFGVAGEATHVAIHAKDVYGNEKVQGGDTFSGTVNLVEASAYREIDARITFVNSVSFNDNLDGLYDCDYTAYAAGWHNLEITTDGQHLQGSPFRVYVVPAAPQGVTSIAAGEGLYSGVAGVASLVSVQLVDIFGNYVSQARHKVSFQVLAPTSALWSVKYPETPQKGGESVFDMDVWDNLDGSFLLSYTASKSGEHRLESFYHPSGVATLNYFSQTDLKGESVTELTDPGASLVFDFGDKPPTTELLHSFRRENDEFDSLEVPFPKRFWSLKIEAFLAVPHTETFTFTITTEAGAGVALLIDEAVLIDDFEKRKEASTSEEALQAESRRSASLSLTQDELYTLELRYNHFDGLGSLRVEIESARLATTTLTSEYVFGVGERVNDQLYLPLVFPGTLVVEKSTVVMTECLSIVSTINTCRVFLESRDAFGNLLNGGGLAVSARARHLRTNTHVEGYIQDLGDGTYVAELDLRSAGTWMVYCALGVVAPHFDAGFDLFEDVVEEGLMMDNPFSLEVSSGPVVAGRSYAYGTALNHVEAGSNSAFSVVLVDEYSNAISVGGEDGLTPTVSVLFSRIAASPEATAYDGTRSDDVGIVSKFIRHETENVFEVQYVAEGAGTTNVYVGVGGEPLDGSPHLLTVHPAPAFAASCRAAVGATFLSGTSNSVIVHTRDRFGNSLDFGGAKFRVYVEGSPASTDRGAVLDHGDGLYTMTFVPTTAGTHDIHVELAFSGHSYRNPVGAGSGLLGSYFSELGHQGKPNIERVDEVIDFEFGVSRVGNYPQDFASVRWTGFLEGPFDSTAFFEVRADDAARLYIDDALVVDTESTGALGSFNLVKTHLHRIQLEYEERSGRAHVSLLWESAFHPRQIIPQRFLYPNVEPIYGSPFRVSVA